MRYIDLNLIDVNKPEVREWLLDARQKLIELSSQPDHESRVAYLNGHKIWGDFKQILNDVYGRKCWYSECHQDGSFEDVDHFRPKSKSIDLEKNTILADGYWWLAYDYMNYRLSCEICNRKYDGGGKWDYFPLKPGTQPASQGNVEEEEYLLLDPCNQHDTELIGYNEAGRVIPLSNDPWEMDRVKKSRRIYNLDCFNEPRRRIQCKCKTALELFEIMYESNLNKIMPFIINLQDLMSDDAPYSTVARQYISLKIEGKPYETELRRLLSLPTLVGVQTEQQELGQRDAVGV